MVQTLRQQWRECPKDLRAEGMGWYPKAHEIAGYLADKHGQPLSVVCGVIGALSPGISWQDNLKAADKVLKGDLDVPAYPKQVGKALAIIGGLPWDKALTGRKENPFAATILDPTHGVLVVDRWTSRTVMPRNLWFNEAYERKVYERVGPRRDLEAAYAALADEVSVLLSQLQATLWCCARGKGD